MAATYTTEIYASATSKWVEKNFVNLWLSKSGFLNYMDQKGAIVTSGKTSLVPIATDEPSDVGIISDPRASINIAGASGQSAEYDWAMYGGLAAIDDKEKLKVASPEGQINLLQERLTLVIAKMRKTLLTNLFAETNASGGAESFYYNIVTASTVGGVSVAAPWAGLKDSNTHATDPVANSTVLTDINAAILALLDTDAFPELCLMSASVWNKFTAERQAKVQYRPAENRILAGYHAVVDDGGCTYMYEPYMFQDATTNSGDVKGWFLMMDCTHNKLERSSKAPTTQPAHPSDSFWEGYLVEWFAKNRMGALNQMYVQDYKIT